MFAEDSVRVEHKIILPYLGHLMSDARTRCGMEGIPAATRKGVTINPTVITHRGIWEEMSTKFISAAFFSDMLLLISKEIDITQRATTRPK